MRIAVASFSHETLTFCPELSTLETWEAGGIRYGPEALNTEGEGQGYITGMKEAVGENPDVELVGILRTGWPRTTGYGSWITTEAFDVITGRIVNPTSGADEPGLGWGVAGAARSHGCGQRGEA